MKKILIVDSSPMAERSQTRKITRKVEDRLRTKYPRAEFSHRDLAQTEIPHLTSATITAFMSGDKDPGLKIAAALSDELIEELLASYLVVIASPMWNFGVPSSLKAWVDHVVRAGKTFSFNHKGRVGLASGKKVILITSAGGIYSEEPMKRSDFLEPYLRLILGFIGIKDIQSIRVEGVAIPTMAANAIPNAEKAVEQLSI